MGESTKQEQRKKKEKKEKANRQRKVIVEKRKGWEQGLRKRAIHSRMVAIHIF